MKRERQEENNLSRKINRTKKVRRGANHGLRVSQSQLNCFHSNNDGICLGNFGLKKKQDHHSERRGCSIRLYPEEHISWKVT